jgi:hypothetical protein
LRLALDTGASGTMPRPFRAVDTEPFTMHRRFP